MTTMEPFCPWEDVCQIGDCTLYLGDCLDVLPILRDQIDCIVTSPPYDNLREYDGFDGVDCLGVISLCARAMKKGGVMVWNVNDATVDGSETGTSLKHALHAKEIGLRLHDTMIWDKEEFSAVGSLAKRYAPVFEYMFVLSKNAPAVFNPIKDRRNKWAGTVQHGTVRNADGSMKRMSGDKMSQVSEYGQRHNVWRNPSEKANRTGHPAPMACGIADAHIRSWTNPGALILDPFMGSGTTGVEAVKCGRKFVGIEISRKYFDIACERIAAANAEPSMFAAL